MSLVRNGYINVFVKPIQCHKFRLTKGNLVQTTWDLKVTTSPYGWELRENRSQRQKRLLN